jgi:hypothetical protein
MYARAAGILILISFAAGLFGEVYAPMVASASTAAGGHSTAAVLTLLRLGYGGYLVEAFCDVTLTLILYVLLRVVNANLALLATFFRLVATAVFGASVFFYISAFLASGGADYLQNLPPAQLRTLTHFTLDVYGYGSSAPMFYGAATIVIGWLIYRSDFLPRLIGLLWILGGIGQVVNTFALVLAPAYAFPWEMLPLLLALLSLALWFLVRGVDTEKWQARAMLLNVVAP